MLRTGTAHRTLCTLLLGAACSTAFARGLPAQPTIGSRTIPVIVIDGLQFRDLDRDGQLTPYEDWRRSPDVRSADLVSRSGATTGTDAGDVFGVGAIIDS